MKILLTGGGTGGHITPILALARELKKQQPECQIIYVAERRGRFADFFADNTDIDQVITIFAGKFRRYHNQTLWQRIFDLPTHIKNLRDLAYIVIAYFQSLSIISRQQPDVVFLKGGFVGMPVGLAAATKKIPFITHDSDAVPGLANRLVARWAAIHATGMPAEFYNYPKSSTRHVGVIVSEDYQPLTSSVRQKYKRELELPADGLIVLVTGGSLGAQAINQTMAQVAPGLLDRYQNLYIIHQVGRGKAGTYKEFTHRRLRVLEFLSGMHRYTAAADVVITRAGANTLAELGVQGRACLVVPNPYLTGGHQIKNAQYLAEQGGVVMVDEREMISSSGQVLETQLDQLLKNPSQRQQLGSKLQQITISDASQSLAVLLLEQAKEV